MTLKKCKDGFQYDDAMWTEEHAREISSTIKKASPLISIFLIVFALAFVVGVIIVVYNLLS